MRTLRRISGIGASPLISVEWIIALSTIIGGLYVLSPFLSVDNPQSMFVQAVATSAGISAFGLVFLFSGILTVAGIVKRKPRWRASGLFVTALCRLFVILAVFFAEGLLPLTWIGNATVMVIAFYIWWRIKQRGIE